MKLEKKIKSLKEDLLSMPYAGSVTIKDLWVRLYHYNDLLFKIS